MQVGFRDLTVWSFLMASAHGAGFMVLPFVLGAPTVATREHAGHAGHMAAMKMPWESAMTVGLHTLAYLTVTAVVAYVVYQKLGLSLLRTAWINLDWLWAGALVNHRHRRAADIAVSRSWLRREKTTSRFAFGAVCAG